VDGGKIVTSATTHKSSKLVLPKMSSNEKMTDSKSDCPKGEDSSSADESPVKMKGNLPDRST